MVRKSDFDIYVPQLAKSNRNMVWHLFKKSSSWCAGIESITKPTDAIESYIKFYNKLRTQFVWKNREAKGSK